MPSALRISAAGMPALEQLVPMTAAMFSSLRRARAAAVPPSVEQPSSWWLNSTSWPAICGRICCATWAPYWLSSPSDSFAPVMTIAVPITIGKKQIRTTITIFGPRPKPIQITSSGAIANIGTIWKKIA